MKRIAEYAMAAFVEAIKKGFPVHDKAFMNDVILVRSNYGRGLLYVNYIDLDDGSRYITVAADKYSIWGVRVARVEDEKIVEVNAYLVPDAVGQHAGLISTFEVDIWGRRLKLLSRGHRVDKAPDILRPFKKVGAEIMYIDETFDYLVVFGDVVPVWYNRLTGRIDDSRKWQKAMGLLPKELEDVELRGLEPTDSFA